MKTKFYLGAIAALALGLGMSSCSNDEPKAEQINQEEQIPVGDLQYVTVRISSTGGSSMGRAASDGGFAEAVGNEGTITAETVRFYFFTDNDLPYTMAVANVNGEVSHTNMVKPTEISMDQNNGSGNATLKGVLVLGTPESGYLGNKPAKVLCVANASSDERFISFANKRLSEIESIIANTPSTWTSFVMTSSTYGDNGKEIFTTDIPQLYTSVADAQDNPVNIYIERLAAKIRVQGLKTWPSLDADGNEKEYIMANTDGSTSKVKYSIELTGWQPMFLANRCYAIKNIAPAFSAEPFDGWNDDKLHRSYWAYTPGLSEFSSNSFDIYDNTQFALGNYVSSKPTENIQYCYENTDYPTAEPTTRETRATAIAVRGIVKDSEGKPANIVYWGGTYYKYEDLLTVIANAYNADKGDGHTVTKDNIELVKDTRSTAKANTYRAVINNTTEFNRFDNILWWKDGVTSFYTTIQHLGNITGVVRNHVYDYEFTGVIGLGVPGNDRKDPEPETETWLAASINVLNWHVVKNSIILQ